ncbi:hypothetical protein [Nocardioides sp. LHG3406-4]|uniref:hypothetical protein n=1 Tax=Nocardioides sp. LHG3406-4 TaxID=2804575 RepID=UPI003CECBEB0
MTAAFSAGSLTGGVAGIVVGRALQRHGPQWVMTGGSALGTVSILGVAWNPSYVVFSGTIFAPLTGALDSQLTCR